MAIVRKSALLAAAADVSENNTAETPAIVPVLKKKVSTVAPTKIATPLFKAAAKAAAAPAEKKAPVKRGPIDKVYNLTANGMIVQMLLEKKHTDDQIHAAVSKKFTEGYKRAYIAITRSNINAGRFFQRAVKEAGVKLPIVAIEEKAAKVVKITKK